VDEIPRPVRVLGVRDLLHLEGSCDERLAAIAGLQRGRVARWQLREAGISDRVIHRMLRRAQLHRLHAGVYAVGHTGAIALGRETAALLTCRGDGFLSHGTAASLWRIALPRPGAEPVDVTRAGGLMGRRAGVSFHRSIELTGADTAIHRSLPVTAPARTLVDCGSVFGERELERALDEALVLRIVRLDELRSAVGRLGAGRQTARLRELIRQRRLSSVTRSQAEEKLLGLIRASGLPEPECNARLHGFTVDFLWREVGVAVEVDGFRFHSTRSAFERDRRKSSVLSAHDIDLVRVTWEQMTREALSLISGIAQTLARREVRRVA
jgi:very-short-patch-repair endonuclease